MIPVRPAGWAVAAALLAAGCSSDAPPPAPPAQIAAPVPPKPPGAVVAAVPTQPTAGIPQPAPAPAATQPVASPPATSQPGGPGWVYPQAPAKLPASKPPLPTPSPAAATNPAVPGTPPLPPGTQTQPIPGTPPAMPGSPPPTSSPAPPPKAGEPKKDDPKKDEKKSTWPKSVNGRSLGEWLADFRSPDPTVRDSALKVIPLFGPEARKAAPKEIIRLVNDPDPGVMINAMLILGAVGTDNKDELKAATRALTTAINKTAPGSMIRLHATRTLAAMGTDAHDAIGAVSGIANDPSWETRQAVAAALGRLGAPVYDDKPPPPGVYKLPAIKRPPSTAAMSKLVYGMLKDDSAAVRMEAMQSIIVLGPPYSLDKKLYPKLVAPYLVAIEQRLKSEKDDSVKIWLYVVEMMYDDRAIDKDLRKVAEYLTASDVNLRVQALGALAVLGPLARPVLADIITALKDPEQAVPVAALSTLISMGSAAKYALEDLKKLEVSTKDKDLKALFGKAVKMIQEGKTEPDKKDEEPKPKDEMKKK